MNLQTDPTRNGDTGIYVRAQDINGKWGSFDICQLTKASLLEWLTSRGGSNPYAEDTVGILLGHGHLHSPDSLSKSAKGE